MPIFSRLCIITVSVVHANEQCYLSSTSPAAGAPRSSSSSSWRHRNLPALPEADPDLPDSYVRPSLFCASANVNLLDSISITVTLVFAPRPDVSEPASHTQDGKRSTKRCCIFAVKAHGPRSGDIQEQQPAEPRC